MNDAAESPKHARTDLVGLIPAAGAGVRAYPYTSRIPKSMLEVDGVPLLRRNVELMRDQLGIGDIRIVVGHRGDVIRRYFGAGTALGVRITYVTNDRIDLELPYSVYLGSRGIDCRCCVILADECYVGSNHAELLRQPSDAALVTCGVMIAEYTKQIQKNYAVMLRDGVVTDLVEKPTVMTGPWMGVGTYLLQPEVFRRLADDFSGGPERQPRDWTSWLGALARSGERVLPFFLTGQYVNINSGDDLNYANALVRDLTFDAKRTSVIHVIEEHEETAARAVLRYTKMPEVDEVVAVSRRPVPALMQQEGPAEPGRHDGSPCHTLGEKIRLVTAGSDTMPLGDLIRLGLEHTSGDLLVLSYNDDTFAPRDVAKFFLYMRDADMVIGTRTTRQMLEQGTNMRGIVRAVHIFLAKLLQLLWWRFDPRFTDVCCVYRGFWRSTYQTIRANLEAHGPEIYPEMVIETLRARRRIIEIPINYYNRTLGERFVRGRYQTVSTFVRIVSMMFRKRLADSVLGRWLRARREGVAPAGATPRGLITSEAEGAAGPPSAAPNPVAEPTGEHRAT